MKQLTTNIKDNYFKNKTIWITGASSGIGEQLAIDLSHKGAKLVLSARREKELKRVKEACGGDKSRIMILPLDLSEHHLMQLKTREVLNKFNKIDILINNGGISQRALAKDTALAVDKKIMDINYFGTIALTKAVLPSMIQHIHGQIIVISSVAGKVGAPRRTAYAASKHALVGFFDALRAEVHEYDIGVTMICPGYTKTKISENALLGSGSANGKTDSDIEKGMSVEYVVKKILRAIRKKREEVYIGRKEVIGLYIRRFYPKLFFRIARRLK